MGYNSREEYFKRVRKAKARARGGQIGVRETRTESVRDERKNVPMYSNTGSYEKGDERSSREEFSGSEKTQFPYQRNQILTGKVRKAGLERCVIDNAKVTSNKSEIGRQCGCDRRTVYRILVEEDKEEESEDNRCPQCGEIFVGYEDEDGAVVCGNCGWER